MAGMLEEQHARESAAKLSSNALFSIGEVIEHRRFGYRGVIVDVDPTFQGTDDWYESVALSRPPKDQPWYHVLPHGAEHQTYVAERNLGPDQSGEPIVHELIEFYFAKFVKGRYISDAPVN
jgi:heat shock protein HspQ